MTQKKNIDEIRSFCNQHGFKLLSTEYINNFTPLSFLCPVGHVHAMRWSDFRRRKRCGACHGTAKHSIHSLRKAFESEGWVLMTTDYTNAFQALDCICPNGHQVKTKWNNFQQGYRCRLCLQPTTKEVRQAFECRGWTMLSDSYLNAETQLRAVCPSGHIVSIKYKHFSQGHGCAKCAKNEKHSIEFVRSKFIEKNWVLLSEGYIAANQPLLFICDQGHKHKIQFTHLLAGCGCGVCGSGGFSFDKPGIFYYVRFTKNNKHFYKIGVTNLSVERRFQRETVPYKVIYEQPYELGQDAYNREQTLLKRFDQYRCKSSDSILVNGNTELFTWDVLGLDKD